MRCRHLALGERRVIFRLLHAEVPVAEIAEQLGRHRPTTHREIGRDQFHAQRKYAGYCPVTAQELASEPTTTAQAVSERPCPAATS